MKRLSPRTQTVRELFSLSGNQCAFPGCVHELVNHNFQFVAQVCHIEAARKGGERFNTTLTGEDLRLPKNLLILCYAHHVETNDVSEYTVARMQEIKSAHEEQNSPLGFSVPKITLMDAVKQIDDYWRSVEIANTIEHSFEELKFEVESNVTYFEAMVSLRGSISGFAKCLQICGEADEILSSDLAKLLKRLSIDVSVLESFPYYENPFVDRNWELHNLGYPNWLKRIEINLLHIEILHYELLSKSIDLPEHITERLQNARAELVPVQKQLSA